MHRTRAFAMPLLALALAVTTGACSTANNVDADADGAADAVVPDAISANDTGVSTAMPDVAPPTGSDGGLYPTLHECAPETYEDHSAGENTRIVHFESYAYTPRCMRIAVGQSVTFAGEFEHHQLRGGISPNRAGDPAGTFPSPITQVDTGTMHTFVFDRPGTYPFYCLDHPWVMYGAIRVE